MISRREWLALTLGAGASLALDPRLLSARPRNEVITRAIPSTGERLPIIGLGGAGTFEKIAGTEDVSARREVLRTMYDGGGRVFDTAPVYNASEEVAGRLAQELGIAEQLFWATKLHAIRPGTSADLAAARRHVETSFERVGTPKIDLIQVHGLRDVRSQLPILQEYKEQGRVRYIGVTNTVRTSYEELAGIMRDEPLDFIGIDYAIDSREVEHTILPLAQERGIAVLIYRPFGEGRLWSRVAGRPVPEWASEFDANSWAQFFLKFVAAHPAITAITPATSRPRNMADNLLGGMGRLPDEATRRRMIQLVDSLPAA